MVKCFSMPNRVGWKIYFLKLAMNQPFYKDRTARTGELQIRRCREEECNKGQSIALYWEILLLR